MRPYWYAQNTLMGTLFRGRLPGNWREQWRATCAEQADQGIITDPKSIQEIEDYLDAWAKFCGLEPREEAPAAEYTITIERHEEEDAVATPSRQTPKPLSPSWPELTPQEKERAQSLTGLPWWYPLQPNNRMDSMWAKIFVRLGRESRSKLEGCYREIAALGRLVKASEDGHENTLEKLEAQRKRVQTAYDEYVLARAAINLEWASYLRTESFLGPEIQALVEKLDAALPTRIDGFKSPADAAMSASLKAVQQATDAALSRAERQHTIAVWTDRVVTAIQFVTAGVTVAKVGVTIFKEVAKQSGKKAAVKAVAKYLAVELATAAASVGIGSIVIPEILAAAGLDPVEVQIGLAAYGAIAMLSTATVARVSRPKKKDSAPAPVHVPDDQPPKRPFFIEGTIDRPRTPEHMFLQWAIAEEMGDSGDYVRVGMGVKLSEFTGLRHSPDFQPDDMGLTHDGRIDIIEIRSPSQTRRRMEKDLMGIMKRLPKHMRGQWRVIDPEDIKRKPLDDLD